MSDTVEIDRQDLEAVQRFLHQLHYGYILNLDAAKQGAGQPWATIGGALERAATAPLPVTVTPVVHTCTKCGDRVVADSRGSWIDHNGGDACDVGVHRGGAPILQEPAVVCPYCQARNNIQLVDISERWNPAEPAFEDGKLAAFVIQALDSDHQNDRYKCGSCDNTVLVPDGVTDDWP